MSARMAETLCISATRRQTLARVQVGEAQVDVVEEPAPVEFHVVLFLLPMTLRRPSDIISHS